MNKVKKTTLKDRIRDAVRAFQGKPKDTIDLGVRVNRCDECAYKREFEALMELPNCNTCEGNRPNNGCKCVPMPGEFARINCPEWRPKKEAQPNE